MPPTDESGDPLPPPACDNGGCGCVLTQGFWKTHPEAWPAGGPQPADAFFNSGMTWQEILDTAPMGNGYIQLAHQHIAAALNKANNACLPDGLFGSLGISTQATSFFEGSSTPGTTCPRANSCGLRNTWAGILDDYNNGVYPGGPTHCE